MFGVGRLGCLRTRATTRLVRIGMLIELLKSKIHRAQVTAASLEYEGSLTIDQNFMDQVGLRVYEKILCSNLANGARFETYAIPGKRGAGEIILNGATALLGKPGDRIIIMSFAEVEDAKAEGWTPKVIVLGENNQVVKTHGL